MNVLKGIYRLFSHCWKPTAADGAHLDSAEPDAVVHINMPQAHPSKGPESGGNKPHPHPGGGCIPRVFASKYAKVIPHDVTASEAVCLTIDVAVLGDAAVAGDSCITGNIFIAGKVTAKGSICITGDAIVLGGAQLEGQICVTGDAFVGGDLAVRGKLDVGGKLCVFGSKDIQPEH